VPFAFGVENNGSLRSNTSETNVDATFYLMLRTINGEIDGAIKVVQQNVALNANNETKTGTLESFRNLKNVLVNIWFRESTNNNLIALKLAENQTWLNTISSQSDVKSNTYTCITYFTQNQVVNLRCEATGPNSVDCYFVISSSGEFKAGCFGGSGADTGDNLQWPPTPPSSGSGGSSEMKVPCPGDVINNPTIAPSSASNINGGRFGLTRKYKSGEPKPHYGLDIYAVPNTPLYAIYSGVVTRIIANLPLDYKFSWGNYIEIKTTKSNGDELTILYAHLNSSSLKKDDVIKQGDLIALSGRTGNAFNVKYPHVHLEVRENGIIKDPENYISTKFNSAGVSYGNPCK
jgi:murein DD-endopeptidase MepM/ murein hydrolase activator NlpD